MEIEKLVKALLHCRQFNMETCGKPCTYFNNGCDYSKMHEDAADALQQLQRENDALREENRWIPVTEMEPDDDDYSEKLVVTFEGYVTCATHVFGWRDGSDSSINVTHWRPLPQPPELKQEDAK